MPYQIAKMRGCSKFEWDIGMQKHLMIPEQLTKHNKQATFQNSRDDRPSFFPHPRKGWLFVKETFSFVSCASKFKRDICVLKYLITRSVNSATSITSIPHICH